MVHSVPEVLLTHFTSGLPKPTENRRTFTPHSRATLKWPNSWTTTSTPIATTNATISIRKFMATSMQYAFGVRRVGCQQSSELACQATRFGIGGEHFIERRCAAVRQHVQHALDHFPDRHETDTASQERLDRNLVGRVERRACGAAGFQRLQREREARETIQVGLLEAKRCNLREIKLRDPGIHALRKRKRIGDRRAHVGVAQLREHGTVRV